jgi:hypothetical protein
MTMETEERPTSAASTRLSITDFIGSQFCVTEEDGTLLYEVLHKQLLDKTPVVLDFSGVRVCASPFFNFSVGAFIVQDLHNDSSLFDWVKWEHLSKTSERLLFDVIENARTISAFQPKPCAHE